MQRCNVTVRLAGDVGNTVPKTNVSVAEIAVLRAIHGDESVVDVKATHNDKTPHRDERDRLSVIYGRPIVDKIFPGTFAKLPVSLREIDLAPVEAEPDLERPLSKGAQRAVAAALPAFASDGPDDEAEEEAEPETEEETEDA